MSLLLKGTLAKTFGKGENVKFDINPPPNETAYM